jgi:serine/threonine-protein kinase RsbW
MATFDITHAADARTCVVRLNGDIDIAVVPELRTDLEGSLDSGCVNLVLDLTNVTYADSSALGLFVWIDHRLRPLEGRLLLAGGTADVTRILELSGLARFATSVGTSPDVQTALEGLQLSATPAAALWANDICIPADVNRLAGVRDQVSDMIQPLGFADSAVFDIKVALGEALANAVRHGAPATGGQVCVTVAAYDDRVVLDVADNGAGFDGIHDSDNDLYAPSGRGIMFMRALMDGVEFIPAKGGGTLVRLVKHRRSGQN